MKMLMYFIDNIIEDIMDLPEELLAIPLCILWLVLWFANSFFIRKIFYSGYTSDAFVLLGFLLTILEFSLIPLYIYLHNIYKRYKEYEYEEYRNEIKRKARKEND